MENISTTLRALRKKMIACITDAIVNSRGIIILPHDTEITYYKDNGDKTAFDKSIVAFSVENENAFTFTFTDEDGDICGPEKLSIEDLEFISSKLCR